MVHSTTKYMGGHSDVIGGAAVTSNPDLYEGMKFYQNAAGGVPGPFDSDRAPRPQDPGRPHAPAWRRTPSR